MKIIEIIRKWYYAEGAKANSNTLVLLVFLIHPHTNEQSGEFCLSGKQRISRKKQDWVIWWNNWRYMQHGYLQIFWRLRKELKSQKIEEKCKKISHRNNKIRLGFMLEFCLTLDSHIFSSQKPDSKGNLLPSLFPTPLSPFFLLYFSGYSERR